MGAVRYGGSPHPTQCTKSSQPSRIAEFHLPSTMLEVTPCVVWVARGEGKERGMWESSRTVIMPVYTEDAMMGQPMTERKTNTVAR